MKKKWLSMILAIVILCCTQTAFAEETEMISEAGVIAEGQEVSEQTSFPTAGHLYTYWHQMRENYEDSPYPEYITGVWTEDGTMENLTFGITDDEKGEAGKQEILRLVENDDTVSFKHQKYSYADLWAVQLEIQEYLGDETGAYGIGVYEMENHVHIDIDITNENAERFMQECFEKYGSMIVFEEGSGIVLTEETAAEKNGLQLWAWILMIAVIFSAGCAFILLKKRSVRVLESTHGEFRETDMNEIKKTIKRAEKTPDDEIFRKIMDKIER